MDGDNDADDMAPGLPDLDHDSSSDSDLSGRGEVLMGDIYNDRRKPGGYLPRRGRDSKRVRGGSVPLEAYPGESGTHEGPMSSVQDDWRV